MTAILLATTNAKKIERIRNLLKAAGTGVEAKIPSDLGLESVEVEEGSDLLENARAKARAYFGKTDLSILGMDSGFFIDNEILDPAMVKRNALAGADESGLSQEQIRDRMVAYYRAIAEKHGGQAEAYWKDVLVLIMPDGAERSAEAIRPVILTTETRGEVNEYFPLRSMYIPKATGKYVADSTPEEANKELAPISEALLEITKNMEENKELKSK